VIEMAEIAAEAVDATETAEIATESTETAETAEIVMDSAEIAIECQADDETSY
jgi:hypothetical protein